MKRFTTLLGKVGLRRSYYHCRQCRAGISLWDVMLGLGADTFTPGAREIVTLAGATHSFREAAERALPRMCGLQVSESSVERTTEGVGQRLRKLLAKKIKFGRSEPWRWETDAQGFTCAYVSVDATGVRQQGPQGARAEGKMAYVALVYNPRGAARTRERRMESQPREVRYLAGFYALGALGDQLRRQAAQVGWDQAEQQIALCDGGSGLEDFFRTNFPKAKVILDFWHAQEHLGELARALFGEGSAEGQAWLDARRSQLKAAGGAAVLAELERLEVAHRSDAVRETHRRETNYFRNHQHKMDYPSYLARGWQIGSGPVESACKTVVNNRLDGSGMRWGSPGSDAVCALRALFLSEPAQWTAFWADHPN